MARVHTDTDALLERAERAYADGHFEEAVTALEERYALRRDRDDRLGAAEAATRVAMYLMMDTGLMAPVRAWVRRAEELLADSPSTPVHAWLGMVRAYERLMCGDLDAAAGHADAAIAAGEDHDTPEPATIARIARARVRILRGEVDGGLDELDDVAVTLASGRLASLPTGMAWCELVCAMQGLSHLDRAAEWTTAMDLWRHGTAFGGINGRCRVHRAELLRLRGSCREAEEEALLACEELRPWMRREYGWPLTELGVARLRRGDHDGAEAAFVAARDHGWEAQPGWGLLLLARGDAPGAARSLRTALARPVAVPSKERPPVEALRRAPVLAALVRAAAESGDADGAREAADELASIARRYQSRGLAAAAVAADGRAALAAGDATTAVERLLSAVGAWSDLDAPYDAAVERRALAQAHRVAGDDDAARLELTTALHAFDRLGADGDAAAVRTALDVPDHEAAADPADAGAVDGEFRLVGGAWSLGLSGETVVLPDLKGLQHVARLLATPSREVHALDLVAAASGVVPAGRPTSGDDLHVSDGDLGPTLDETAKRAYRRRLLEVEEDIEDATRCNDPVRAELAEADRDFILRELANAVGLGGRDRPQGADAERARTTVTRTIRYAIERVTEHHPALGAHLDRSVRTGTWCAYDPDPLAPVTWRT